MSVLRRMVAMGWMSVLKRLAVVLCIAWVAGVPAVAQPTERVAVLMTGTGAADDQVTNQLSDAMREGALRAKRETGSPLTIMSRESIMVVLEDQGIDASCVEGNCEVETARNLGATYVLTGTLSRFDGMYVLTAKIHDVKSGDLLESDRVKNQQMIELMDDVEVLAHKLFRSALGQGQGLVVTTGSVAALESLDRGENRVYNKESTESGLLVVKVQPAEAEITINPGNFKGKGPTFMKELAPDKYVVTATMGRRYHPFQQQVTVSADGKLTIPIELRPAFGRLEVTSEPEGARVSVDGVAIGQTPLMLSEVLSGDHVVKIEKDGFHTHTQAVSIQDEALERVSTTLLSAIGGMKITSQPTGADVWLRGQKVGVTPFSIANLDPGVYPIRLSKPLHLDVSEDVAVREGGVAEYHGKLTPNYGTLRITTKPEGAVVILDGKKQSQSTPARFPKLKAGSYSVVIQKEGYGDWSEFVTVDAEQEASISPTLQAKLGSLLVKVRYPDGGLCTDEGSVFIDGENVGSPPYLGRQLAIRHKVRAVCNGMEGSASVEVRHNERSELEVPIAKFTIRDLTAARSAYGKAVTTDFVGGGLSAALWIGAALQFDRSSRASREASLITNAQQGTLYQEYITEAQQAQRSGIGLSVAATSVASAVVWHWMKRTQVRKVKLKRIERLLPEDAQDFSW